MSQETMSQKTMSNTHYEIVFYGALVAGFTRQQTQEHVAQLFKTSVDQVERMFTGNRVVIRNKLDHETALKYIIAMEKRGAECQIEAMGEPGVNVQLAKTQTNALAQDEASAPTVQSKPVAIHQEGLLPLAGEKVDAILASTHFELAPPGERLSEIHNVEGVTFPGLDYSNIDTLTLAPTGSDLTDKKQEIPVSVPDTSHIKVAPLEE